MTTSRKRTSRRRTSRKLRRNESTPQRVWYHGSNKPISKWEKGRTFLATDGKKAPMPLWLSPAPEFAALYARGCGSTVYEVLYTPKRTFPEQEMWDSKGESPYGRWLTEEILSDRLPLIKGVPDSGLREHEAYESLKYLSREMWDIMETSAVIKWAKKQGFDSVWVQGDGVRNLMVLDPSKAKFSHVYLQREECR